MCNDKPTYVAMEALRAADDAHTKENGAEEGERIPIGTLIALFYRQLIRGDIPADVAGRLTMKYADKWFEKPYGLL